MTRANADSDKTVDLLANALSPQSLTWYHTNLNIIVLSGFLFPVTRTTSLHIDKASWAFILTIPFWPQWADFWTLPQKGLRTYIAMVRDRRIDNNIQMYIYRYVRHRIWSRASCQLTGPNWTDICQWICNEYDERKSCAIISDNYATTPSHPVQLYTYTVSPVHCVHEHGTARASPDHSKKFLQLPRV